MALFEQKGAKILCEWVACACIATPAVGAQDEPVLLLSGFWELARSAPLLRFPLRKAAGMLGSK